MKKTLYGFLVFFVVLILSVVIVANSSFVIKKIANIFTPEYKISYDDIRGNIFTGVKISGLKYDGKMLTKNIIFSWNPSKLLYKRIAINKIGIEALDVSVLKSFIASFQSDDNSTSEPFPLVVLVGKFALSVNPFEEQGILVTKTLLEAKDISYASDTLDIDRIQLQVDSNITNLSLQASLEDDTLSIEKLSLRDVDSVSLEKIFLRKEDNSTTETAEPEKEKPLNPLIPQYVLINDFHMDVLPATYDPVKMLNLVLDIKDVKVNVAKLLVENASINLRGKTNLTNFTHSSKIQDNELKGEIRLTPNNRLFELYQLPVRKEAIGDIVIDLDATEKQVAIDIRSSAKYILINEKHDINSSDSNRSKEFNIDIDSLVIHAVYTIKSNILQADSKVMLTTPYAEDISVTNTFIMDRNISYKGAINVKELIGIDANYTKALQNLNIQYTGDLQSLKTDIVSDGIKGSFNSADLKKAVLHIETTKSIVLREILALPAELNNTKVDVIVDVPLDFAAIIPLKANVKILSNVSNIDAELIYDKSLKATVTSNIPENSLLKAFDENVKWNSLNPLVADVVLDKNNVSLKLKTKVLSSDVTYTIKNGNVDGTVQLAGLKSTIHGNAKKKIMIKSNVSSIKSLFDNIREVYTLKGLPPVEGALDLSIDINELKEVNLLLSSPAIIYHSTSRTDQNINDINLILSADKSKVQLKSYTFTYDETKFFATKPSIVNMDEENIEISELWINDELKVSGSYNTKTKKGNIGADATVLNIAYKFIDIDPIVNIKTVLNGEKTSITGKITLPGGNIHYDLSTKTYPSDSDILIVQDMKQKEASPFLDNLSVLIEVKTKKPLVYKQGPIDIQAIVDLSIHKAEYSELMFLGEVEIVQGGSYIFEGKKFVLDKSHIYFTGNPNKPLLDMSVKYKSLNHLITIGISGTPAAPNITFSSVPSLQKEQILSIILFDSEGGAGTNSGEDMMKMMGGAMAKSALLDLGIKLDHLAIGSSGSVEVGKRITDKITFIYVNDEVPQVRVKYQHSTHLESVISADEESQAYDIIYERDF